jgi:hypothetical protein
MKAFIVSLLFAAVSLNGNAHEYFFAFAEMEYNAASRSMEITLEGSAHDIEDVLNETGIPVKELEDHYTDAEMLAKLERFINNGLQITSGGKTPHLSLKGYEVKPTGLVYFYLVSDQVELTETIDVRFDWLMDTLPKQQNKITLTHNHQHYTAVFLPHQRTSSIKLETK